MRRQGEPGSGGKVNAYLQVAAMPRNFLLPGMEAAQEIPCSKAGAVSGSGGPCRPLRLPLGRRRRCIVADFLRSSGSREARDAAPVHTPPRMSINHRQTRHTMVLSRC